MYDVLRYVCIFGMVMSRKRKRGIPGLSFSWKRATGLSAAKNRISRKIGVPLTRSGRQRKVGRAMGCCVPLLIAFVGFGSASIGIAKLFS
jgi:hypothetical protein